MARRTRRVGVRRTWRSTPVTAVCLMWSVAVQPAAAMERVADFGENPGNLSMYLHRPEGVAGRLPLVVALHGCTQSAAAFGDKTGLVALAGETPFVLLLPEQRKENMSRRCFRWYDSGDNRAGRGETASIMAMIDHLVSTETVDPDRVYLLGLSAGGAMTAVLMANAPERFAGGAVLAGVPFGCNRPVSIFDAAWYGLHYTPFAPDGADASYACGIAGFSATDRDASDWAGYIRDGLSAAPTSWPLISLWQGSADTTVDPANLRELTEQWTAVQGIDADADERQHIAGAVREVYRDSDGTARVETWRLDGFRHAVPIDADGDPESCGMEADHISDADICAVRRIADFWQLW